MQFLQPAPLQLMFLQLVRQKSVRPRAIGTTTNLNPMAFARATPQRPNLRPPLQQPKAALLQPSLSQSSTRTTAGA